MKLSMWHTERKTALLIESPFALTAYEFTANRGKNQLKKCGKVYRIETRAKGEIQTACIHWGGRDARQGLELFTNKPS